MVISSSRHYCSPSVKRLGIWEKRFFGNGIYISLWFPFLMVRFAKIYSMSSPPKYSLAPSSQHHTVFLWSLLVVVITVSVTLLLSINDSSVSNVLTGHDNVFSLSFKQQSCLSCLVPFFHGFPSQVKLLSRPTIISLMASKQSLYL